MPTSELHGLHVSLAILTILIVVIATIEGGVRAFRALPEGAAAKRTRAAVLIATGTTASAGLALLIRGKHPGEWLHLLYAAFAFGLIPMADNSAATLKTNRGKGLARFGGGLVCLLIITRLFVTGSAQ
jgi:hypothetical protein